MEDLEVIYLTADFVPVDKDDPNMVMAKVRYPNGQIVFGFVDRTLQNELHQQGGQGSGNFDHEGRPGQVGGSQKDGTPSTQPVVGTKGGGDSRVEAAAKRLGYPSELVSATTNEGPPFIVDGVEYATLANYNSDTRQINMYSVDEFGDEELEGMLAHEVQHAKWDDYQRAYKSQLKAVMTSIQDPDPTNWLIKGSGTVRDPADSKKLWAWETHEKFLKGKSLESLKELDGVTPYSEGFWKSTNLKNNDEVSNAINETLAEISRLEAQGRLSGTTTKVNSMWMELYRKVRNGT